MAAAKSWTCSDCGVRVSFAPGAVSAWPQNWIEDASGWHCLGCRREAAMAATASGGDGDGSMAQNRRRALVEFELLRDPEARDFEIAKRAKCATSRVRPIRRALVQSGRLG
jgi:hypothetical protein